jgi:hypothetical protein
MFVRTRKNAIALATGAIVALIMPLTSMTPASADSVRPATAEGQAAVTQAVALGGPVTQGTQVLRLRMIGLSRYLAAGPVYPHLARARNPADRRYGWGASWRIAPASHPRSATRCACGTVRRAHALAARSSRHPCGHRVRPRRVVKCECRLVVRVHRVVHRAHAVRCQCRLVVLVHRAHPMKCHRRLAPSGHRVLRVHVAKCGCRPVRHVRHVVRVIRHTHCTLRTRHHVYRVAHVRPRRVQAVAVHHCRRAAAHTTLLSFHRSSWSRPWGHVHHCGHWA